MLPSFLQKVEVVAEASRETCVALSDCLHLFTKQEGVGRLELNFYSHCLGATCLIIQYIIAFKLSKDRWKQS